MNGVELLDLMPKVIGFFRIGNYPGVVLPDHQGWLFDGGSVPHPVTRTEVKERGGVTALADEAAELFDLQPGVLDFLKKKNNAPSSTGPIKQETLKESLRMKAKVLKGRDTFIRG